MRCVTTQTTKKFIVNVLCHYWKKPDYISMFWLGTTIASLKTTVV